MRHLPAVVALLDMTAQRRRAAGFDRRHDAALAWLRWPAWA